MKIAFLSPNRETMPDAVIPLGLLSVMASCPEAHARAWWDLCFEHDPVASLRQHLAHWHPDVVAIGLRNLQSNDYGGIEENLDFYASLVATIREHGGIATIVVGGSGFSVMPETLMHRLRPDYGIVGEGERAFGLLLSALEREGTDARRVSAVPGLCHFDNGALVTNPRSGDVLVDASALVMHPTTNNNNNNVFLDLDALPTVDRSVLDERYYTMFGIDSVQSKRGCGLECDYCTYPSIEGRRIRLRAPESVANEFQAVLEAHPNVQHCFIVDSVFNIPRSHAKAVCRALIARGGALPWTCYANPRSFDEELAELMVAAGCAGMEIGSDSGCNAILQRLKKGFDTSAVRRIHRIAAAAGLKDCHTFILGTQGETLAQAEETLDFVADLDPFAAIFMIWVDDQDSLDPSRTADRAAHRERLADLFCNHERRRPDWIAPSLGINFNPRLFDLLRRSGKHGPLWQHIVRKRAS